MSGSWTFRKLEPSSSKLRMLRTSAKWLIYTSVLLGVALLVQLDSLVPAWLFYSVAAGWLLYLIVAVAAATGRAFACPSALALAFVTLLVSLPQPEHQAMLGAGLTPASLTFIIGSLTQVGVMISVASYLFLKRYELRRSKDPLRLQRHSQNS